MAGSTVMDNLNARSDLIFIPTELCLNISMKYRLTCEY